jgi:hypothetical protein
MVVTKSTVGNAKKSKGLEVCSPIINTKIDSAILKVNKRSNPIAGIGKIIIASNSTMMIGPAIVLLLMLLKDSKN